MFRFVKFARLPLCRAVLKPVPASRMISSSVPARSDAKASSDAASATSNEATMRLSRTQFDSNSYDHSWADHYVDPRTRSDPTNRTFTYFVLGGGRFLYAATARVAVLQAISYLSPSADVLALSSLEVDIAKVLEGTSTTVMWRGKPVFIRHRNAREIASAKADDKTQLRDPQPDASRVQDEKWLIVMGICTHFGCVPVVGLGDYGGWFCPCHGSHYDTSGRIRKGPAPLNLEVPPYRFLDPTKILLG